MKCCPHCGSSSGLAREFTGVQYYDWSGEPTGYDVNASENQSVYVCCVSCGRRFSLGRIKRNAGVDT